MAPTEEQLRRAAHREYGHSCSLLACEGRGNDRTIVLPANLEAQRDDSMGGTWITAYIWINDECTT